MSENSSEIDVAAILRKGAVGKLLGLLAPAIDRLLGLRRLRQLYERDGLRGLDRFAFVERILEKEGIRHSFAESELARVPKQGQAGP